MKLLFAFIALFVIQISAYTQQVPLARLKVFIDCSNTWCDMQHIRTEINVIDFVHNNQVADVHVLITSQYTASGGNEYQLIFFGQHQFENQRDTMTFNTHANATEFEDRDLLFHYLKTGLIPYVAKTKAIKYIDISLKSTNEVDSGHDDSGQTADPWNAWVMNTGAGGSIQADANYETKDYYGNFSANRITEKLKSGLGAYYNKNKSTYKLVENGVSESYTVNNHNWSINHYMVKSLSDHWSAGYELKYIQNTFSNNKGRALLHAAVEYNVFPYKEASNKILTLSYGLTARSNTYYDTTIFDKTKETLFGHRASINLSFNQKWGNSFAGISYHNYFSDWNHYNLRMEIYNSVRITGGLSAFISAFGAITRDQIFLVKGDATPEEVLARRRQLASDYNFYTSIGFNFRFGSQLNNVVNPRFDRSGINDD